MSIKENLLNFQAGFTPSERRLVQILLADYPRSGLVSSAALARQAQVSAPTVLRFVMKLGFDGYPAFQAALLSEVDKRFQSPLNMVEAKREALPVSSMEAAVERYSQSVIESLQSSRNVMPAERYAELAEMLVTTKGKVYVVGGRFSGALARILAGYLRQFRPDVIDLQEITQRSREGLIDMGPQDCMIVFDYRRYQPDVVEIAQAAAKRGVSLVLFTDEWLSPLAEYAKILIPCRTEIASAYDTLMPALLQVEVLFAILLNKMDEKTEQRFHALEELSFNMKAPPQK